MKIINSNLSSLEQKLVSIPRYDRSKIKPGIVHIGPSHFARGHIFQFVDRVLETDPNWGIRAISLKSPATKRALQKQDYLYSLTENGIKDRQVSVIGSLIDITVAQEDPNAALDVLSDPNIKVVFITVTQDGYGHNPTTGNLDFERTDIQACLSSMDEPSTTVGYLVAALARRYEQGAPPLTIMSCDNMPANGTILRNVVLAYAAEKSSELRRYIEDKITFPSTMVDRIVPTTNNNQSDFNLSSRGIEDSWPIGTEQFKQWVIENNFAGDMPDLASAGATIAQNVEPFEFMKLRMLNGAHMALGCVAGLAGYKFVHEAMEDERLQRFVDGFITEAASTVPDIQGVDFSLYQQNLVKRLKNPHIKDELVRLARNGTQKMNGRILDTIRDAKSAGRSHRFLAFATAAWIQYLKGQDDQGNTIEINDENAVSSGLQRIARNSNGSPEPVMAASGLFDTSLMKGEEFVGMVRKSLRDIQNSPGGTLGAVQNIDVLVDSSRQAIPAYSQSGYNAS